ncbi:TonB-dependent receptor [Myxococcota bacterium]|nr:TonB-dependent receptor [Myxococcota bacterium]
MNTFRAVVGLDGSFADEGFFSTWSWDANFVYGRTTGLETKTGNLIRSRLADAMGPSFIDADGVAYCGTPDAPIADCTPINLFGGAGSITQDMVKGLTYTGTARGYTDQRVANIQASGEIFELWKRPVGLAVGYAFRREEGGLQPDPLTARGDTTGNKSEPVFGGFSEHAGFAEVNLPLLADLPGVQLFEVDAALRVFNFDTFGTDSMYKFGGRWQIVDHVALRATYSRAFRAPSVAELYSGQADSFQDIVDPCSTFDGAVRTPEAQANCAADNVPDELNDDRTQLQARVGGNPNLTPETANILTAGIVVTPKVNKMLDGLSLTLDYFAIAVDNSITSKGGDVILANCYTKATRSDCDLITRDPGGFVSTIIDTNTNAGGLDTAGIDFGLIYDMPSDAGSFRFTFDGVILSKIDQELANGRIIKGKDTYDLGGIYPTLRWNASVGWAYKGISAGLAGKFTGSSKECGDLNDCSQEARDAAEAAGEPFFERTISSNFTADLYAGYSFSTAAGLTSIQAGINNLFDSPPPVIFNAFYYSDASAYDFIGRYFYIGLRQSL